MLSVPSLITAALSTLIKTKACRKDTKKRYNKRKQQRGEDVCENKSSKNLQKEIDEVWAIKQSFMGCTHKI
jgi:hypothetical protein